MRCVASAVNHTSTAANSTTKVPMTASMVIASLSWKPRAQGDTIKASPAASVSHSSHIANAASAAIDDTAMKIPIIDAVWQGAPAGRLNSHGEKNKTMPSIKFATSQSLALDHSSMTASV